MRERILLVLAVALALAALAFVACGDEGEEVEPAQPAVESTPTMDMAATGDGMDPASDVVVAGGMTLAAECVAGGNLPTAEAVISCNREAMEAFVSFTFDAEFDLFAAFPIEGAAGAVPAMRLHGIFVRPDRTSFLLTLGPEGEAIETSGIIIGEDFFTQDPATKLWFKGVMQDEQSLAPLQQVGILYMPQNVPTLLKGVVELDDGTKAYVLVSEGDDLGEDAAMLGLSAGNLTRIVGVDDFQTKEVRATIEGPDGELRNLFVIRYHGFGKDLSVEPPDNFVELPQDAMTGGVQEPATVLSLGRNADGNVEVTFSKPVFVEGEIVLYVLEPSTGGWELPLMGGSGTETLVFDASAEGNPTLVEGEHEIAFIGFGIGAQIVDEEGVRANDLFEAWTYE